MDSFRHIDKSFIKAFPHYLIYDVSKSVFKTYPSYLCGDISKLDLFRQY